MKKNIAELAFVLFFCLIFISCSNGYMGMFNKFNDTYAGGSLGEVKDVPAVGDKDFVAEDMILPGTFTISNKVCLYITGPKRGKSYRWYARVPKYENSRGEYVIHELSTERDFFYKMPGVFKIGVQNTLFLEVTDSDDELYTDSTSVVLYE